MKAADTRLTSITGSLGLVVLLLVALSVSVASAASYSSAAQRQHSERMRFLQQLPWPPFEGNLVFQGPAVEEASSDSGFMVETPLAVLQPASYSDVQTLIVFANKYNISVSARGRGHCTAGQVSMLS